MSTIVFHDGYAEFKAENWEEQKRIEKTLSLLVELGGLPAAFSPSWGTSAPLSIFVGDEKLVNLVFEARSRARERWLDRLCECGHPRRAHNNATRDSDHDGRCDYCTRHLEHGQTERCAAFVAATPTEK